MCARKVTCSRIDRSEDGRLRRKAIVRSKKRCKKDIGSLSMLVGLLVRSFGRLLVPEEF